MASDSDSPANDSVAGVIVTYHRPEGVARSVAALRAQHRPVQHIFVVDNGGDVAEIEGEPQVTVVRAGSNTGAAGGFAIGLQAALDNGFDWAYVINDDDRPRPQAIGSLLALATTQAGQPKLAMGWVNLSGREAPTGAIWKRGLQTPPWLVNATVPYEVDVITFGGLLIPTAAIAAVGVPRADFFMMWEEYEYCLRLRRAGWSIVVEPQVLVDIDGLAPGTRSAPWRAYYEARNSSITISNLGTLGDRLWWIGRQCKLALATLPAPDRSRRLSMRGRGVVDAVRGRTGRTVEP
jgi:rhamnopyranosyl-N-acetylglucosaminyl-diphospho-decaprenol beta-1,3/1,4-galactofuranosyltransferase